MEEEKKAVERVKRLLSFNLTNPFLDHEADDIVTILNLIEKQNNRLEQLEKENKELKADNNHQWEERCKLTFAFKNLETDNADLKQDLKYVLDQTLGAFEKNWCIDWNFTEVREKYNLGGSNE